MKTQRSVSFGLCSILMPVILGGCALLEEPASAPAETPASKAQEPDFRDTGPDPASVASPSAPVAAKADEPPQTSPVRTLEIDSGASSIRVLVYAKGKLSRLGTNHVVEGRKLSGSVTLHEDLSGSVFSVDVPVESLVVDDPEARRHSGDDFSVDIAEDKRREVRENMLGNQVLNALNFPVVTVEGKVVGGDLPDVELGMTITLLDRSRRYMVPATAVADVESLQVSGEFSVKQSDFGIEPFSMLAGAFSLRDEIRLEYLIVAREGR